MHKPSDKRGVGWRVSIYESNERVVNRVEEGGDVADLLG